jgi:hypothetical protein
MVSLPDCSLTKSKTNATFVCLFYSYAWLPQEPIPGRLSFRVVDSHIMMDLTAIGLRSLEIRF